jgi:putative hydrolase of the HAD superfamily
MTSYFSTGLRAISANNNDDNGVIDAEPVYPDGRRRGTLTVPVTGSAERHPSSDIVYSRGALDGRYRPPVFEPKEYVPPPSVLSKFTATPKLVTLDCTGTLMQLTTSAGMFYREELFKATDCRARLPPPIIFNDAFSVAFKAVEAQHPCFGAKDGLSSEDWWRLVVERTYQEVPHIDLEEGLREELADRGPDTLFETVFSALYNDVFTSGDAWELKKGAVEALESIATWRQQENGPTHVGCISNFDERLHLILENLGIKDQFDFVLTSREVGSPKPNRKIFDEALKKAGCDAKDAVHVGDTFANDVVGAAEAGWHPIFVPTGLDEFEVKPTVEGMNMRAIGATIASEENFEQGNALPWGAAVAKPAPVRLPELGEGKKKDVEHTRVGDLNAVLSLFGAAPASRIISTTRHLLEEGAEGMAEHHYD